MDLKELESGVNPFKHWYYQNKKKHLLRFVKKKIAESSEKLTILDIGSGSGFFSEEISTHFKDDLNEIILCDIGYTDQELSDTKADFIKKVREVPEQIENTIIIMMDLLEHIENDHEFVAMVTSKCQGANYFYITVPAFKSVWSGHDDYLGHYRRHTIKSLRKLMGDINHDKTYYIFMSIFPFVWLYRKLFKSKKVAKSDMKGSSGFVNSVLKRVIGLEFIFNRSNRLFGLTCVLEGSKID